MFARIIPCVLLFTVVTDAVEIPFIRDVTFVPISNSTSTLIANRTCDECLCEAYPSHRILNCFSNNTCQFFTDIPLTYRIQSTPNARMYFPQQILPNASKCCTSDTSALLSQLSASTPTYADVTDPGRLILDHHGYLVTVSYTDQSIVRFHPDKLTRIDQPAPPVFLASPRSLAHRNGVYYVGFKAYILIVHSSNMSIIHTVSTPVLYDVDDMMFLNDGQQMIATSMSNSRLVFFNRSAPTSYNYDFIGYRNISGQYPHGLVYVNDALFYLSLWSADTVYAFAKAGNEWNETLAFNASSGTVEYMTIDDCGRFWVSLKSAGVKIFDSQGSFRGSLHPPGSAIVDVLVRNDYVIYLSDANTNRIIRIDPNIEC